MIWWTLCHVAAEAHLFATFKHALLLLSYLEIAALFSIWWAMWCQCSRTTFALRMSIVPSLPCEHFTHVKCCKAAVEMSAVSGGVIPSAVILCSDKQWRSTGAFQKTPGPHQWNKNYVKFKWICLELKLEAAHCQITSSFHRWCALGMCHLWATQRKIYRKISLSPTKCHL